MHLTGENVVFFPQIPYNCMITLLLDTPTVVILITLPINMHIFLPLFPSWVKSLVAMIVGLCSGYGVNGFLYRNI